MPDRRSGSHGSFSAMADRPQGGPEKGTPEYNWLYGSKGQQPSGDETRAVPQGSRPDETRVMPAAQRDERGRQSRPASPPPPKKPVSGSSSNKGWRSTFRLKWLWILLVLWLIFLIAIPLWAWSRVEKIDAFPQGNRPDEQPGTTYLMVGSDSRGDLTAEERKELGTGNASGNRTDTIMVLHTGDGPDLRCRSPVTRWWRSRATARPRSTRRTPMTAPSCWSRRSRTRPASGSTTSWRSASAASSTWSTPLAG